jgi:hypothetical protein
VGTAMEGAMCAKHAGCWMGPLDTAESMILRLYEGDAGLNRMLCGLG